MKYIVIKSRCHCAARTVRLRGQSMIRIPLHTGFGDALADWIHRLLRITPCAACQRRRRILNLLFPYIRRDSLEYRAWNAYLASGLDRLPCVWDSETDTVSPVDGS